MKVLIDRDEYWPYYSICRDTECFINTCTRDIIDVPDEFVKKVEDLQAEVNKIQGELETLWNEAKSKE